MMEERLLRIIGDVDDDLVEDAATCAVSRPIMRVVLRWGAAAACLALVLGLGLTRLPSTPQLVPQAQDPEGIAGRIEASPYSSPMGVRRFFNHSGYRYAFLENGAPYDLSKFSLTDSLGTLEHDIVAGMEGFGGGEAATLDLATTFALGGEIYELPGYDPAFRLAVVWQGEAYLAELVGRVDNEPLDASFFFSVADTEARLRRVEILSHPGGEVLATVKGGGAKTLVRLLADSRPAQLTEEDYLAIASAQATSRSWQAALCLDDGTSLTVYLIPDLGFASFGDSTYLLPENFQQQWGRHLEGLTQGDAPLF